LEQQIEQARQELATMKAQAERLDDESLKELVIAQAEHRFRQRLQQIMDIERAS
jgi:alpha/beta superfamily hydrolase